jgi:hypothetical protein
MQGDLLLEGLKGLPHEPAFAGGEEIPTAVITNKFVALPTCRSLSDSPRIEQYYFLAMGAGLRRRLENLSLSDNEEVGGIEAAAADELLGDAGAISMVDEEIAFVLHNSACPMRVNPPPASSALIETVAAT